ncbi:hypothetical protein EYF80_066695 [Liparis tanakae]|uniref:Uncharacterized protein n=1 Tax=Liparis tanakae TaxID=230148 RepID=A0A4Z2E356_9TELE|nr:hypothetical protein EYF80_066695 [Liparis tanakae]
MVTSLLETMFIVNIQNSTSNKIMVPRWLSVLVLQYLAVIVLLPRKRAVTRATYFSNTATTGTSL